MDAAHRRTGSLFLVVGVGLILAGAWGHGWATTESGHSLGLRDILAPDGATHGYTGFGRGNARLFAIATTSAYWTALVTAFFAVVALGNALGPTPARRYLSAPRLCGRQRAHDSWVPRLALVHLLTTTARAHKGE